MSSSLDGSAAGTGEYPPSAAVLTAVSEATGTPVTELPVLFDVLDPGALDALVAGGESTVRVTFEYAGYTVTVDGEGTVSVAPAE